MKKKPTIEDIPQGLYCYDSEGVCPYWTKRKNKPKQQNGYCKFLKKGDWDFDYFGLLWDQCKECNVFTDINEHQWSIYYPTHKKYHKVINIMKKIWNKIKLWNTIPAPYSFRNKVKMVLKGKICRCKFCKKYFLTTEDATNTTQCSMCWCKKMMRKYGKAGKRSEVK